MKKILVTGGTVFVSKYIAEYYIKAGNEVYVLNRNHHPQPKGAVLIEGDRHDPGDKLKGYTFDAVLDVTAYTGEDIEQLLDALGEFKDYILISSSAVYPEYLSQPFTEEQETGANKYWGAYGTGKIDAEKALLKQVPSAYVFRPPYLYGLGNNVYREAFVFECAEKDRKFYLPRKGEMKLQFFHVMDLCRCIDSVLEKHPENHIFNVGNEDTVSIREWVNLCYEAAEKKPEFAEVYLDVNPREYFSFHDYEYRLDVEKQRSLISNTLSLQEGLEESYLWYQGHKEEVNKKDYIRYLDEKFGSTLPE